MGCNNDLNRGVARRLLLGRYLGRTPGEADEARLEHPRVALRLRLPAVDASFT